MPSIETMHAASGCRSREAWTGALVCCVGEDVGELREESGCGAGGCCVGVVDAVEDGPLLGLLLGFVSGVGLFDVGVVGGSDPVRLAG